MEVLAKGVLRLMSRCTCILGLTARQTSITSKPIASPETPRADQGGGRVWMGRWLALPSHAMLRRPSSWQVSNVPTAPLPCKDTFTRHTPHPLACVAGSPSRSQSSHRCSSCRPRAASSRFCLMSSLSLGTCWARA
eukprot:scaffold124615_cov30-Tisochrysis_lutea.AAC.3